MTLYLSKPDLWQVVYKNYDYSMVGGTKYDFSVVIYDASVIIYGASTIICYARNFGIPNYDTSVVIII